MADESHYTGLEHEGQLVADGPDAVAEARKMHRIASADPEPERDGLLTGPAHELKYGLERAEGSVAHWISRGVHPTENRRLQPGDDGYEDADAQTAPEDASAPAAPEDTAVPVPPDNASA